MANLKCPQCGMNNWETARWCQNCKAPLTNSSDGNSPHSATPKYADFGSKTTSNDAVSSENSTDKRQNYPKDTFQPKEFSGKPLANDSFIVKTLKKNQLYKIVTCLVLSAAVLSLALYKWKYLSNAFFTNTEKVNGDIFNGKPPASLDGEYINISGEKMLDTGAYYYRVSKSNKKTVEYKYGAIVLGDKYLLAKVDPELNFSKFSSNGVFSGELNIWDYEESTQIVEDVYEYEPEMRGKIQPYVLDMRSGYDTWAYILSLIGLTTLGIAGYVGVKNAVNYGNFDKSSISKQLSAYGEPRSVAAVIENEFNKNSVKHGKVIVTDNWLINAGRYSTDIKKLESIVWIYKATTQHYTNFIPTGKSHEAVIYDDQAKLLKISLKDHNVEEVMVAVTDRIPWVVAGFSDEIASMWKSDPKEFIAAVNNRRKDYIQQQNQPAGYQNAADQSAPFDSTAPEDEV